LQEVIDMSRLLTTLAVSLATVVSAASLADDDKTALLIVSKRSGHGNIFQVNPDGSGARNLTAHESDNSYPAWSPDGKRIAFASNRDGTAHVYVMDADGKNIKQLTKGEAMCRVPTWSADGKTIAFCKAVEGGSQIWAVEAGGGEPKPLGEGDGWDPAFSPDGKKILFASMRDGDGFRVYVMDADGSNVKRLTDDANPFGYVYPTWSPDGKRIAWTGHKDNGLHIFTANADGKNAKALTDLGGLTTYAAFSPDGKTIAFFHSKAGEETGSVYTADAAGGQPKELLKGEAHVEGGRPAWRPK
jgi:TolB protein